MAANGRDGNGGTGEPGRSDLHERLLERYGAKGEALYMVVAGFLAITVNGLAAYFLMQPLLFPSLSPTVFTIFRQPLSKDSSPRNVVLGHVIAAAVGFVFLWVFGLYGEPSVLREGVTLARVFAAAGSVAATEAALILLRVPHPPAGTTTLLVALGLFTTPRQLISLAAGIALVTAVSWIINCAFGAPVPIWAPRRD